MSIHNLGPSALTPVIPSINTTIASAAEAAGAAIASASQSSFQEDLPLIKPLVATKMNISNSEHVSFTKCMF